MISAISVKHESNALVLNGACFDFHAMVTVEEHSDHCLSTAGSVVFGIHTADVTGLKVGIHLSSAETRQLGETLLRFACLADAKCAELSGVAA